MKVVVLCLALALFVAAQTPDSINDGSSDDSARAAEIEEAWSKFVEKYNKTFSSYTEERLRKKLFTRNFMKVARHNADATSSNSSEGFTYTIGVNKFSDMRPYEFRENYLGYRQIPRNLSGVKIVSTRKLLKLLATNSSLRKAIPPSVDWRTSGIVSPVKNQGRCGSCFAFSTTATLESAYMKKYGTKVEFSEQYVLECTWGVGNEGCNGGDEDNALKWVQQNGIVLRSEKPYKEDASPRSCPPIDSYKPATVTVLSPINSGSSNEDALKIAVYLYGVVSIAIDATNLDAYSSGIFNGPCGSSPSQLNHAVNIVGYNTNARIPYWIVRNSWGPDWGIDGYFYLPMNKNKCGLNQDRAFATY